MTQITGFSETSQRRGLYQAHVFYANSSAEQLSLKAEMRAPSICNVEAATDKYPLATIRISEMQRFQAIH